MLAKTPRLLTAFVGSLSLQLAAPSLAPAQCPIPDKLDGGPCCAPATANIPLQRDFSQSALDICWLDCDVENVFNCRAEWKKPLSVLVPGVPPNPCEPRSYQLTLRDPASGAVKWRGKRMITTYSRTWMETDVSGIDYQVWRFLVNGDMSPTADAGPVPCPVPRCAAQFQNRVRFTGYLDYARNCGTNAFSYAWMLTHACDLIDHSPAFPRAGIFHPDRSYTFVGPAGGFAVGAIQPVEAGGTALEAMRRLRPAVAGAPAACLFEEPVDAFLDPQQEFCLCGSPVGAPQWVLSSLGVASLCGSSLSTPGGPFLPGYLSMGIGTWTDPTTYPGLEALRWNAGNYDDFDPCVGATRSEVFFGVTTLRGNSATQVVGGAIGMPLPLTFVDQASSIRGGSTVMNLPYLSEAVLNLNFP